MFDQFEKFFNLKIEGDDQSGLTPRNQTRF